MRGIKHGWTPVPGMPRESRRPLGRAWKPHHGPLAGVWRGFLGVSEISPGDLDNSSTRAEPGAGENSVCVNSRNLRTETFNSESRGNGHWVARCRPCQRQCGSEQCAMASIKLSNFARQKYSFVRLLQDHNYVILITKFSGLEIQFATI